MKKRVLVVTSSPRKGANTTLLAEAFIKGAEKNGYNAEIFDVNEKKIEGCMACNKCWSKGIACVSEDPFNEFVEKLRKADAIVVASPVYWGNFPSTLKALVDKMYSFCMPWCEMDISGKQPILLTCGDGADDTAFEQISDTFGALTAYMKWKSPKVIAVPQLVEAGAVKDTDGLKRAELLGESI